MNNVYSDYEDDVEVTVVSFYHFQRHHAAHGAAQAASAASGNNRGKRRGCKRELLHDFIGPDCMQKKKPLKSMLKNLRLKKLSRYLKKLMMSEWRILNLLAKKLLKL